MAANSKDSPIGVMLIIDLTNASRIHRPRGFECHNKTCARWRTCHSAARIRLFQCNVEVCPRPLHVHRRMQDRHLPWISSAVKVFFFFSSVSKMCDAGCQSFFYFNVLIAADKTTFAGQRPPKMFWSVALPLPAIRHQANIGVDAAPIRKALL